MDENQVFGWDDTGYVAEDTSFEVLPEGEYDFEVRKVLLDRYKKRNSASNIPDNCPMAVVHVMCTKADDAGNTVSGMVFERLYLYSGGLGRISAFFKSIGLIPANMPANQPMPMSFKSMFDQAPTMTGRCKVTVRTYKDSGGKEQKSNNVRFLTPDVAKPTIPQAAAYQPQASAYQPAPAPAPAAQPVQQQWGGPGTQWGQQGF